mmetsp:Transcript_26445/g.61952  ORF Transcript_26445/g.61952 Transcript_26445/m.61952 type:complete len:108 (+) Transcript_26445:765-1088(+)
MDLRVPIAIQFLPSSKFPVCAMEWAFDCDCSQLRPGSHDTNTAEAIGVGSRKVRVNGNYFFHTQPKGSPFTTAESSVETLLLYFRFFLAFMILRTSRKAMLTLLLAL